MSVRLFPMGRFHDVAEHAALVLSCATDPARPRRELDQAVAGLHHAAANLASLARQYCRSSSDPRHDIGRDLRCLRLVASPPHR